VTRVAVVIASWNTREMLRECLAALQRVRRPQLEIAVVDNASTDGSAQMVASEFASVVSIANSSNDGFARACNQGIAATTAPFVLLLNADTVIDAGAIEHLAAFLEQHSDYAAAAPQLANSDGSLQRSCMRFPRWSTAFAFATPMERWVPESAELRRYFCRDFDHAHDADVEQPPAACLLLRRSALAQVGVLDEKLPLYFNDVDLSLRLARAGWRTRFVAAARCVHHVGSSTRQRSDRLLAWHSDRLAYYRKHFGRSGAVLVKLCVSWSALDFCVRQVLERDREPVEPVLRSLRTFLAL
jgi:GT2 family glycosyltransferase